jgi:predicted nucleic acid-binding protein
LAKLAWFDQFLLGHQVFAIDTPIARRAADLRAFLSLQGEVRTQADMLIAATAQIHGLSLVTRNVRDFEGCGIPVLNPFRSKPF